jgi:hypothetical protein
VYLRHDYIGVRKRKGRESEKASYGYGGLNRNEVCRIKRESENARAEDPLLHQPLKRTQSRPSGCD